MIQAISIDPHQIGSQVCVRMETPGPLKGFPFLSLDRDSYIVGLQVQNGIDFDVPGGRHCIAMGKCCSLAESITFMLDLNHDYKSVCQGELSCLKGVDRTAKIPRKDSIILQNDVWIGHGATVMAGVTLHNGCAVAAGSVVTKDVPPYGIVGGNPARLLRWRFEEDLVDGLQKIAWWDWPPELQRRRQADFSRPVPEFVEKYLPEAEKKLDSLRIAPPQKSGTRKTVLFIPDLSDPYPLYQKVLAQYFAEDRPGLELLLYLSREESTPENLRKLEALLRRYEERDCDVILQTGETLDEHILFQYADCFITTRDQKTVFRTCLADLYQVKILYGTDEPVLRL